MSRSDTLLSNRKAELEYQIAAVGCYLVFQFSFASQVIFSWCAQWNIYTHTHTHTLYVKKKNMPILLEEDKF